MKASLLQPSGHLSQAQILEISQQVPIVLRSNPKAFSSSPIVALFSASETPELWAAYENLLLSSLTAGDDEAANQILERLIVRFGNDNERILAFKGLVKEAGATNNNELEKVLNEYDNLLEKNGANVVRWYNPNPLVELKLSCDSQLRRGELPY